LDRFEEHFEDVKVISKSRVKVYSKSIYGSVVITDIGGVWCVERKSYIDLSLIFMMIYFSFFIGDTTFFLRYLSSVYLAFLLLKVIVFEIRSTYVFYILRNTSH
jgi:hypothetical protein